MRLALPARPGTPATPDLGRRTARRAPAGTAAVVLLVALPVVVFGIPALLGHPVWPGDDLTQNFPLRVLAGRQIRGGQIPLYDPYIWSGAPLLAGWNAGAAYPLTFLFAVVPAAAAWTLNMIVTWAVAGLGMFSFLRALRLGRLAGVLGALCFAFSGAMVAQVGHLALVAGMSWVPVQLLAVLRLTEAAGTASRLRWTAVLAGTFGLTILAGEPRAVDDAFVIVGIYAAWRIVRLGRRWGPAAVSVAAGLAIGVCLGAVQWLPGLAAVGTSQRSASTMALFESGSLPAKWLLLMLVPDLLGGSGSFGQPSFIASYNLAEVTGYVGILPLVAATALLGRLRLRPRPPEWAVWHVIAVAGVLLAVGGRSPLGHLLIHVPLFGDQRLQSRNILVADLALAVLLGYWADEPFTEEGRRLLRAPGRRRIDLETVLGVLPGLAVIAVVMAGLFGGAGFLRWLRVSAGAAAAVDGRLRPWLVPYALIAVAAIAFVIFGRRRGRRGRSRWLGWFVAADLVVFTLLGVVAVLPGPGGSSGAAASQGIRAAGAGASARPAARSPARTSGPRTSGPRPIAALGYPGRFAIYDPDELDAPELPILGAPDLNVIGGTPSVQGYSSIADGRYASATGSHHAMGEGQDVLKPGAVGDGTLDQLDTSVLLTPPAYLITAAGRSVSSPGPSGTGQRDVAADHETTWYFGRSLTVSRLEVADPDARRDAAAGMRIGLTSPDGSTRWFPATAPDARHLEIRLPGPVTSVAVAGRAGADPVRLGPASVGDSNGSVFVTDGQLQDALQPPRWGYAGHDGALAVFADHFARPPLSLEALAGRSTAGASVRPVSGPAAGPTAAAVVSPHGVRVVRSVSAIPGWSATWHPRRGRPVTLAVRRAGLVQAVDVPPGTGVVTWSYVSPGFPAGFALSLGAAAFIVLLMTGGRSWHRRRTGRSGRPGPAAAADGMLRSS